MRTITSLLIAALATLSLGAHAAPGTPAGMQPMSTESSAPVKVGKVGLNTASAEVLQRELAGIGLTKAQAIVAHRETNGKFSSVDELLEVNGIGKSLLDRNQERLMID